MIGLLPAYASHFTLVARACERQRTPWNHLHALWVRDGFIDIDIRSVAAGGSLDEHSHSYDLRVLVLQGQVRLDSVDGSSEYRAGDLFSVSAGLRHSEWFGGDEYLYLAGRRHIAP